MSDSESNSSPPDCRHGIELTRQVSTYDVAGRTQSFRMYIRVSNVREVSPNIFRYYRTLPADETGEHVDEFDGVCSPADLEDYPEGEPNADATSATRYFRLGDVDLVARSTAALDELWELILADRDELVRSLDGLCELGTEEINAFGTLDGDSEPDESDSESDSTGDSESPATCPVTSLDNLYILATTDPVRAVGETLVNMGATPELPACTEVFELENWRLSLHQTTNTFTLEVDYGLGHTVVDTGHYSAAHRLTVDVDDHITEIGAEEPESE